MAYTIDYADKNSLLKQIKVGQTVYNIEDEQARANLTGLVDALKEGAYTAVVKNGAGIKQSATELVTGNAVYEYLKDSIQDAVKALVFRGISTTDPVADGKVTIDGQVVSVFNDGDVILVDGNNKEYVYANKEWHELGDEGLYLTKNEAANTYVKKTVTVAGIDLQDNISAQELSTALKDLLTTDLKLGALAHKDSASGNVSVPATFSPMTVAQEGDYTLEAANAKEALIGLTAASYTPTGTIKVSEQTPAAVNYDKIKSVAITSSIAEDKGNYTPAGKVTVTGINISTSPLPGIATNFKPGKLATMTTGSVKAPSLTKTVTSVPQTAYIAKVQPGSEILELTEVAEEQKVDVVDVINWDAGATTLPVFTQGELPSAHEAVAVAGINKTSATATFEGTPANLAATPATEVAAATVAQQAVYTAAFNGAAAEILPGVTKDNFATAEATVKIGSKTVTPAIATNKDVAVTVQ